ncbi:MAG: MFS transporter [Spirochaetales bacterium]|nr:MFS transporter [Spirochaetales bacterium]
MTDAPKKLFNRNFLLLWQGQFISQMGTQMAIIGEIFWVKHSLHMATLVGLTSILWTLTTILFGPIGGSFADTHSRKKIIVLCDILSGIGFFSLSIVIFTMPDALWLIFGLIITLAIINGIIFSAFNPAIQASVPDIVPARDLQRANSITSSSYQISVLVGQSLGGVIFKVIGAPFMFLVNSLSFLYCGITESFIKLPDRTKKMAKGNLKKTIRAHMANIAEGLKYIFSNKGLRSSLTTIAVLNFFSSPIIVLLPFFVEDTLHIGAEWYGFFMGGFGMGAIVGYILTGILDLKGKVKSSAYVFSITVMAVLGIIFALSGNPVISLIAFTLIGILKRVCEHNVYHGTADTNSR